MPTGTNKIPLGEYEHLCEIDVAYEGFVVGDNGELFYVYLEATVIGYFENKWHMSYETASKSYEVLVHPADNAKVVNQYDRLSYQPESIKDSAVQDQVRRQLLDSLLVYYQEYYGNTGKDTPFGPVQIKIDVPADRRRAAFQDDFAQLKSRIENGTIRRSDFKDNVQRALKREIDTYFACFDPNDSNYKSFWAIEDKFDWESMIPVWGGLKMATESFNRGMAGEGAGHYFHSVGHFLMAFADVICVGMGTGATGLAKSGGILKNAPKLTKPHRPYFFQQYLSRGQFEINPRITDTGCFKIGRGQFDWEHRATTLLADDIMQTGKFGIRNYRTIYFNKMYSGYRNGKYYMQVHSIGINPWKRTIFHEGPSLLK